MQQQATFAAGCFCVVEARFAALDGVIETEVGYMGGTLREPSYQEVCTDRTGHAEVVQLTFDPEKISYELPAMRKNRATLIFRILTFAAHSSKLVAAFTPPAANSISTHPANPGRRCAAP